MILLGAEVEVQIAELRMISSWMSGEYSIPDPSHYMIGFTCTWYLVAAKVSTNHTVTERKVLP